MPPGTALAVVLSEAEGCCRGARPRMRAVGSAGIDIPAEARQGAQISIAIEGMRFEGGGTLPPRFFPLPNGQDVVRAFSDGPPLRMQRHGVRQETKVLPYRGLTGRGEG